MVKFPIEKIIIEGPDLAGKTTLFNKMHDISKFRWNIQDRSALSMLIYAKMYNRDTFHLVENLKKELFNLNNQIVLLLPPFEVLSKRFQKRGDPIQNLISLKKLHKLYAEFEKEYGSLPNVTIVKKEINDQMYLSIVGRFLGMEKHTTIHHFPGMCVNSADTQDDKEVVGIRLTYFDNGEFTDVKPELLEYEGEKEYYNRIEEQLRKKIAHNHSSDQDLTSRRIIYHDDSCISLAHFLIRDQMFDAKFFLRSSNVKDTLKYDINFIHYLTSQVYQHYHCKQPVKIEVLLNSAHICNRIDNEQ
tara:strand:- start:146 stop:1051 length:906 start_codon:yes stop_codon:yes gene_type:complete